MNINTDITITILSNLIYNEDYTRRILAFIKPEYFQIISEEALFRKIKTFVADYGSLPTKEALMISVTNDPKIPEAVELEIKNILEHRIHNEIVSLDWLIEQTEKYCQERAIYLGMNQVLEIFDDPKKSNSETPKILMDAISLTFNPTVGHSYFGDINSRFDFYHKREEKLPFDLKFFNQITNGGVTNKTLNVILAKTGVGKTMFMCHFASSYLMQGKNVLYISLEMSEERIAERIDANLLNVNIQDLKKLSREEYEKKVNYVKTKTPGRLFIKEYPTATASAMHFRALLNELLLKQKFTPDVIFIDYINIACSSRFGGNASVGSYGYVKSIAEEFRGLAVEFDVPIWSCTQSNRSGGTDLEIENVSESYGISATVDLMIGIWTTDELEELSQVVVKQLKNRYNDLAMHRKFVVGIDRPKMRLYDVEDSGQTGINNDIVVKKNVKSEKDSKFNNINFG